MFTEDQKPNSPTTKTRPRGRPPKFPPDQVRERLVDSGIRALRENGVEIGLDAVALDAAIVDADVPRGMSYRIWQDSDLSPQNALRREVVLKLLSLPTTSGIQATRARAAQWIEEYGSIDTSTPQGRKRAISEMVRVVGGYNHELLDSSEEWRLYNALRSASLTRESTEAPEIMELLRNGEDLIIEAYSKLFSESAQLFGLRMRSEFSIEQFAATAHGLNEGLTSRLSTKYERSGIWRADDDGDLAEWSLFAIGLEALIHQFFAI